MSEVLKLGIVGCGQIARSHLATYQGARRLPPVPGVKMVACCDVNEEAARAFAEQFDIPNVFTDYHDLLAMDEIVAVDVCLHNNLHAPISIAAMEAGKHVYCEKPLAGAYADAKRMVEKSRELGKMLHMQLGTLYSDSTLAAKRLIDEDYLGKLYYAKSSYYRRRGRPYVDGYGTSSFVQKDIAAGGALYDMGVYHIGQMLYLLGNPGIITITGSTHTETAMYEERRENGKWSVEELALGFIRLEGGITFTLEEAWAIHLGGTDGGKIVGAKGGVTLDPFAYHTTIGDMEMDGAFNLGSAKTRWLSCFPETHHYIGSQHHWAAALRGDCELLPTAEVGLNTMLVSEGIYLSQELGREVTAEEVLEHSVSTALDV
jgi:predicted dehydrogenase